MSARWDKLRALRVRTGAPLSACDEALQACSGDVDAAAEHRAVLRKNLYDGDPRHTCHDGCPPWRFRWLKTDHRGHLCSTHCQQHPSPHWHSLNRVWQTMRVDPDQATGALSICDWDPAWAVRFLCEAGAAHLLPGESPVSDGPRSTVRIRQRFGAS